MTKDRVATHHLTGHSDFLVNIAMRIDQYVLNGFLFAARQKQNREDQECPPVTSKSLPHGTTSRSELEFSSWSSSHSEYTRLRLPAPINSIFGSESVS
jgi:hypothetical protein